MPISFVGIGTISSGVGIVGTTGFNVDMPAGVREDDLLILYTHRENDTGDFDTPTGWTRQTAIDGPETAGNDMSTGIFTRLAPASPPASYALTHTDTVGENWSAVILAYRGVDTTTPLDVTPAASHYVHRTDKASPNVDAFQEITTVTDGAYVLALEAVTNDDITSNADPDGYTNRVRHVGGSFDFRQIQVWDTEVATADTVTPGAPAYTSDATVAESAQATMALRPADANFVDYEVNDGDGDDTSLVVNVPNGTADGDVMVAFIHGEDSDAGGRTLTLPGGWTSVDDYLKTGGNDARCGVAYRVASSEPASYTFTMSTGEAMVAAILTYRGIDNTNPIDTAFTTSHRSESNSGTVGSYAPPAITTTTHGARVVCADMPTHINNYTTSAGPTGYDTRFGHAQLDPWFGAGLVIADKEVATAGPETPGNWGSAASSATQYVNYTIALRPDSAGAGISIPVVQHHRQRNF